MVRRGRATFLPGRLRALALALLVGPTIGGCCEDPDLNAPPVGSRRLNFQQANAAQGLSPSLARVMKLGPGSSRELMVKLWYPTPEHADSCLIEPYGFHTDDTATAAPGGFGVLLELNEVRSASYQGATVDSTKAHPVLFYSHGYGFFAEENEPIFEALAMQGYVVVSIGHPYDSSLITTADGEEIRFSEESSVSLERELAPPLLDPSKRLTSADLLAAKQVPLGTPLPADLWSRYIYESGTVQAGAQEHLDLWVRDTKFVLSELERISAPGSGTAFAGSIDFSRIGAFGWSFGGATSRRFCVQEKRCLASINLDGSPYARANERSTTPYLRIASDLNGNLQAAIREEDQESITHLPLEFESTSILEDHGMIALAEAGYASIELRDSCHQDFAFGWLDIHDFGTGAKVRHAALKTAISTFFNAFVNEDSAQAQAFCQFIRGDSAVNLRYTDFCAR